MSLARRLSIGANYEVFNAMFGMAFSNGYDELTFLRSVEMGAGRYESFTKRLFYKMNLQTNFHQDYSFGLHFKWRYPFAPQHFRPFSMFSAGYSQSHYPSKDFTHRDVYVSASTVLDYTALTVSTGYQTLNDFRNWGVSAGFYTRFKIPVSIGLTTGYYVDYLTYSIFLHGRLYRNIHYRLTYDRIDTFNFFSVGFNFIIYR